MKEEIMTIHSEAMRRLLKTLGMGDMAVISFNLKAEIDKLPTIEVVYYLHEMPHLPENVITQDFELVAKSF